MFAALHPNSYPALQHAQEIVLMDFVDLEEWLFETRPLTTHNGK